MAQGKILIAAGGTGGHIYPALAIADAFKALRSNLQIEFVGTAEGLENRIVPAKGYKVHHLPIGRLNSNVSKLERIKTVLLLPLALLKSALLLWQYKPDFVLGVGGHASGPLLLMATLLGYRNAIWEPNAMPGMANRILSRFVQECWVVFDEAKARLHGRKMFTAGMPVRREIEQAGLQDAAANQNPAAGSGKRFRILVTGGSQGARGINKTLVQLIRTASSEWLNGVQFVHQTGAADYATVRGEYGESLAKSPVELREFIHDMAQQYAMADLVISRSGTGTLSELAACGKPSILIPFPFAADDHQRRNAESLVQKDAAVMILQKDLSADRLQKTIDELRQHPERLKTMAQNIRGFHQPQAAEKLAQNFLERIDANAVN